MTSAARPLFCPNCGAELPLNARYCTRCGAATHGVLAPFPGGVPVAEVGGQRLPLASVRRRFGALLIDWLVGSVAIYSLFALAFAVLEAAGYAEATRASDLAAPGTASLWGAVAFFVTSTLLSWGFDSYGWSPGKAATGVRVVRLDSCRPGIVHGLVRNSMRTVGILPFGLGYFWAIWDDRNQAWHDKLASTVVVLADPLRQRFPERSPLPLVTRPRIWWLSVVGGLILFAGGALNAWVSTTFDEEFWESERFAPQRTDSSPRIHSLAPSANPDAALRRLEG